MAEEESFPNWSKPATKGDVLMVAIYARGLALQVFKALRASEDGDAEKMKDAFQRFNEDWEKLTSAIDTIAGRQRVSSDEL